MATESKQSHAKPFTPSLSSKFRGTKSPLTPRLAGSAPHSPASSARRDVVVRRSAPPPPPPPRTNQSTTPVSALNSNVTPRSSARKPKRGPESPGTPGSATRVQAPPKSPPKTSAPAVGLGISAHSAPSSLRSHTTHMTDTALRQSPPTRTATAPRRLSAAARSAARNDEDDGGKFIRAEAARPSIRSQGSSSSTRSHRSSDRMPTRPNEGKLFAAGTPPSQSQGAAASKPWLTRSSPNSLDSKFFRANEIRGQSHSKSYPDPTTHEGGSGASPNSSRLQTVEAPQAPLVAKKTVSPRKPTFPSLKALSTPELAILHTPISPTLTQHSAATGTNMRPPSISSNLSNHKTGPTRGHAKVPSTGSLTVASNRSASISPGDQPSFSGYESPEKAPFISLSPNTMSSRSFSLESSSFATSITSDIDGAEAQKLPESVLPGPELPGSPLPDDIFASVLAPPFEPCAPMSPELPNAHNPVAATARRERKVLDLEISNSSLLAINKTLERELRKQTVELRRFRRLTQSGKLSLTPTHRTVSNSTLGTVPETFDDEQSDSEQDEDSNELDEEDSLSGNSDDPMSPSSKANQRARDEKRLLLNLSKHQQILVDSQKLTQSIRRCLTCTEVLIHDANKAINYQVGIGDIKLGGRVLSPDELELQSAEADQEEHYNQGLLSPSAEPTKRDQDKILAVAIERLFQDLLAPGP